MKQLKTLRSISLFDQTPAKLNADTEVIFVAPHETLIFQYGSRIEKITSKILPDPNWITNKEYMKEITDVEEAILTYCVRHPDDARRFLIVKDDQEPLDYQVRFSDFNVTLDYNLLTRQGFVVPGDDKSYIPPRLTIMFLCLRKKGIATSEIEQQEIDSTVESFPENPDNNQQTVDT